MALTSKRLGILGGGQLGRMMVLEAQRMGGIECTILDSADSPAMQCVDGKHSRGLVGSFNSRQDVERLVQASDVVTIEIEHISVDGLDGFDKVHPRPETLRTIQDKYRQKEYLSQRGIKVVDYVEVHEPSLLVEAMKERSWDWPIMLKTKKGAYDGRGNLVVRSPTELERGMQTLGGADLYAEKMVDLCRELAVMVVKQGDTLYSYPVVETIQKDSICHLVIAPAQIKGSIMEEARDLALEVVGKFSGNGIFGVEMFLDFKDNLYLNEVAPRPHNSGHYTIEACSTSQFENTIRAVLDMPIGDCSMVVPAAMMINVLGAPDGTRESTMAPCLRALKVPGASVHLYGKKGYKAGRKMGHITVVGDCMAQVQERAQVIMDTARPSPVNTFDRVLGSDQGFSKSPMIGIIMGSDSDLPKMKDAKAILDLFGSKYRVPIPYEMTIVSAHRTPDRLVRYAKEASGRGLKVMIAGAGGAAHLPGMVAAMTTCPVVGVPIMGSTLGGVDSLLSICQMPRGIPVATVAVNNSTNAALLALRILSVGVPRVRLALEHYNRDIGQEVVDKLEGFNVDSGS